MIFSGLIAAIFWNLLTWWFGIPSSSSHTLIGGFLGAALMHAFILDYNEIVQAQPDLSLWDSISATMDKVSQQSVVKYSKVIPIFLFIFMAPVLGAFISITITSIIIYISKNSNPHKAEKIFKKCQLASSALLSLGHGLNDAQKVMGIIGAAVIYHHEH